MLWPDALLVSDTLPQMAVLYVDGVLGFEILVAWNMGKPEPRIMNSADLTSISINIYIGGPTPLRGGKITPFRSLHVVGGDAHFSRSMIDDFLVHSGEKYKDVSLWEPVMQKE